MATVPQTIDRARVLELTETERAKLQTRTAGSDAYYERALKVMPRGVPSSFQAADPRPIYLSHGEGSHVWDVDGNEYLDFHNGFGVMCVGHANPQITAAVRERAGGARTSPRRPRARSPSPRSSPPLRPAAVALHELRHRVDHGRRASRARGHRPRRDPQDRGLLPRPPRRRDGLGPPARRRSWRARRARQRPVRRRPPARGDRADDGDPVQRRGHPRARARRHGRPRRGADPRAGDDEHHGHPA